MQQTQITLPFSGRQATIRRPTGRDMVEAERVAGESAGRITYQLALISRIASIDGRVLPFEDFQDLDHEDIEALGKLDIPKEPRPAPPT